LIPSKLTSEVKVWAGETIAVVSQKTNRKVLPLQTTERSTEADNLQGRLAFRTENFISPRPTTHIITSSGEAFSVSPTAGKISGASQFT
jgi:hypothetical protein